LFTKVATRGWPMFLVNMNDRYNPDNLLGKSLDLPIIFYFQITMTYRKDVKNNKNQKLSFGWFLSNVAN